MKIIKSIKAQAALEFLTTYGWAFLVIFIMIGTLAYFGILNPSKVLPNRCNFGSEFQCLDYQISAGTANTFKIRIKSNVPDPIDIQSITLSSEGATPYTCSVPPANPTGIISGSIIDLSWSSCNTIAAGFTSGSKGKVLISIRYNSEISGPNYAKDSKGEVYSSVI